MQINLTGHHVEITEALRDYVNNKFAKLERHFDHINNVHVVLSVEKLNQIWKEEMPALSDLRLLRRTKNMCPKWRIWIKPRRKVKKIPTPISR